jgi:hypothetical protein
MPDDDRGPARVAVVGSGSIAAEVVRNLGLAGIPVSIHRSDDFWSTLRLADLQDCYCAVAAGVGREAGLRLNRLSQVAAVDFVMVSSDARGITVETFPFGSDVGCACLECDPLQPATDWPATAPDPIADSIAGALAAAIALQCSHHGARRLSAAEVGEANTLQPIARRADCPACAPPWRAPRVIRTRNRWLAQQAVAPDLAALSGQAVLLSDALITACECTDCGQLPALAALVGQPASAHQPSLPCPGCGQQSLRIETRSVFTLGELMSRFGGDAVPAKFALADIGGLAVCFDLEPVPGDAGLVEAGR